MRAGQHQLTLESLPRLLPTPTAIDWVSDANLSDRAERLADGRGYESPLMKAARDLGAYRPVGEPAPAVYGVYADAVAQWETCLRRPAPSPTEAAGGHDTRRLSPRFVEWMMGLPDGWITDVPGITRTQTLRALGNGVVPQQAAEALRRLLDVRATTQEAAA